MGLEVTTGLHQRSARRWLCALMRWCVIHVRELAPSVCSGNRGFCLHTPASLRYVRLCVVNTCSLTSVTSVLCQLLCDLQAAEDGLHGEAVGHRDRGVPGEDGAAVLVPDGPGPLRGDLPQPVSACCNGRCVCWIAEVCARWACFAVHEYALTSNSEYFALSATLP
jgi:hypothetical protein